MTYVYSLRQKFSRLCQDHQLLVTDGIGAFRAEFTMNRWNYFNFLEITFPVSCCVFLFFFIREEGLVSSGNWAVSHFSTPTRIHHGYSLHFFLQINTMRHTLLSICYTINFYLNDGISSLQGRSG